MIKRRGKYRMCEICGKTITDKPRILLVKDAEYIFTIVCKECFNALKGDKNEQT